MNQTTAELLSQIEDLLPRTLSPSLNSSSNASDLYEAYLFTLVIRAAQMEGAVVSYLNSDGSTPTTTFTFRTSPGYIHSRTRPYTHAVLEFAPPTPLLEVHIGVRVSGKSTVLHECDVAVIYETEATTCRWRSVSPRSRYVLMAIECKFYSSTLSLGLARAFMGLDLDLSTKYCYFVTNTTSNSIEKLLTMRNRDWESNLTPSNSLQVTRLQNVLSEAFKRFIAKSR